MTSEGTQDRSVGASRSLSTALDSWAAEPRLTAAMRNGNGCYLVVSGDAAHVLYASPAAAPFAASICDEAGVIRETLRIDRQIGRVGTSAGSVSLVRLQLDSRRLAPPATCLLSRGQAKDGSAVLLLAFEKPVLVRPRRALAAGSAEVAPETPQTPPIVPEPFAPERDIGPGARFVWRSDAEGRFGEDSGGASPSLRAVFSGRSWAALAACGRLIDGQALLAALDARCTFRAVPVAIALSGPGRRVALDVSGAPLARAGRPFEGYGGFGLVRAMTEAPEPRDDERPLVPAPSISDPAAQAGRLTESAPSEPEGPGPSTAGAAEDGGSSADAAPDTRAVGVPVDTSDEHPSLWEEAAQAAAAAATDTVQASRPPQDGPEASRPASRPDDPTPPASADITADAATLPADDARAEAPSGPAAEEAAEDGPPLSVNEHAAFREIAKALGARFAGDEEEPADARAESVAGFRVAGGSVTPFPSRPADAAPGDAVALLDGIPAGLLVCRGETLVHANRRLLDLAGFPDLAALLAEGGLARLFRGLPPQRLAAPDPATAMSTRDGGMRDTEVERARIVWLGEPADCLLVRPRPEGGAGRHHAAAALADTVVQGRASDAEAALDDLEDAVVGLDRAGRLLSLNRAAAALFGCAPREVVGGGFADLFSPESGGAVRSAMQAAAAGACEVVVRGGGRTSPHLLSLSPMRGDGRRTAVLRAVSDMRPPAPTDERAASRATAGEASDFAARIGREIRAPMTGIVGFADLMLAEPHGPLGDERYRATVRDIRLSGAQVLALVDDLAELSRLEAGQRELAFGPLTLNDLVADCVAHLQPQAAAGRVLLRTSFAADLSAVVADEPSLRQAALAVIAGAIRDTAAGGQVIVSTTQAERGEVALRVRDTGAGIPDEAAAQTPPGTPRKHGATGLGLPLTRALVEANHGRFRVSSRKDEGTLVEMLFSVRGAALRA